MVREIATELEARLIGNKDAGIPSNVKCCSATRATSFGCEYPSEYSGYRLVPKNVLTASAPRFKYYSTDVVKSPFLQVEFYFDTKHSTEIIFDFDTYTVSSSNTSIRVDGKSIPVVTKTTAYVEFGNNKQCWFNNKSTSGLTCTISFSIGTITGHICTINGTNVRWNSQTEWYD